MNNVGVNYNLINLNTANFCIKKLDNIIGLILEGELHRRTLAKEIIKLQNLGFVIEYQFDSMLNKYYYQITNYEDFYFYLKPHSHGDMDVFKRTNLTKPICLIIFNRTIRVFNA